jgi:hypothetical protein
MLMAQRPASGLLYPPEDAFVMTVRTTTDGETFQWPNRAGTRDGLIDWGDGLSETSTGDLSAHTYATAGDYDIVVTGTYTAPNFSNGGDKLKVRTIKQFGTAAIGSWTNAFYGCTNLTDLMDGEMACMIGNASGAFRSAAIATWPVLNIPNVTSIKDFFRGTSSPEYFPPDVLLSAANVSDGRSAFDSSNNRIGIDSVRNIIVSFEASGASGGAMNFSGQPATVDVQADSAIMEAVHALKLRWNSVAYRGTTL